MAGIRVICLATLLLSSFQLTPAPPVTGLGTLGTEDGGSCGFTGGFPVAGTLVTGFSEAIYGAGSVCGGCYAVQCTSGEHCNLQGRVIVTVTNECMAQNMTDPCAKPKAALNLQPVAYDQIATSRAPGVVGITWTPTPCIRTGGVQFMVTTGDNYYLAVLIQNVAGPGQLSQVFIQAGNAPAAPMTRSYGSVWQVNNYNLAGQPLTFTLVGYNGQRLVVKNALPANWTPQTLYPTAINFPLPLPKGVKRPIPKK